MSVPLQITPEGAGDLTRTDIASSAVLSPPADSILSETLRLTAAVLVKRVVVEDKVLQMSSGQQYKLRRGDKVILFPFLSPQMDPEIHPEPQVLLRSNRCSKSEITSKQVFLWFVCEVESLIRGYSRFKQQYNNAKKSKPNLAE